MGMFSKIKLGRNIELTSKQKIEQSQLKIDSSLSMFKQINQNIEDVNSTLVDVIDFENSRIDEAKKNLEDAKVELQANKGLQEQLAKFLK